MKRKNPHAVALGRKGGQIGGAVRSAIKTLAARENGDSAASLPFTGLELWLVALAGIAAALGGFSLRRAARR